MAKRARSKSRSRSRSAKKRRTNTYKSINRRAQTKNRTTLKNVNFGSGFPAKATITHRYDERITLANAAPSAINTAVFCANGIYDPNVTGTGHQPMYFDQMGALYDQYTVIMAKCVCTFTNTGTVPCYAVLQVNDDSSVTATSYSTLIEAPNSHYCVLGSVNAQATKTLTAYWGIKKWFGKGNLSNPQLLGTTSGNPTETVNFVIATQPMDNTTVETVYVDVRIEYTAVWTELKDIAQS